MLRHVGGAVDAQRPPRRRARLVEEIIAEPDAYFVRVETVRLEHELRAAVAQFDTIAAEIVDAYEAEGPALRTVEACRRFGRMCEYFRACTGGDIESDNRFVQIGRR